ncbi:MAG TPA: sugar ABC transporter substrate-binding protein [Gaiellales bacterium]
MRRVMFAALTLVAALAAAACGSGSSDNGTGGKVVSVNQSEQQGALVGKNLDLSKLSPDIKDPDHPVTITFESPWVSSPLIQKLAKEFHQIHPNITVQLQAVNQDSEQTKLTTQIAGGNAPDSAYMDSSTVGAFAPRGALVSLNDYMGKSIATPPADYPDAFKTMNSYQGQFYALPYDGESTGLFYRKDLFQTAGIPAPPKTWAEMQADAQKLTNSSLRQYGIALFATQYETSYYFYPFLYQAGGSQTTDDDKQAALNTPEAIKAAQFYTGLSKYSPPDLWNSNSYDGRVAFATGKVGMYIAGAWMIGDLQRSFPKVTSKWEVAPMPTMDAGSPCQTTIAGNSLAVFSQSKNPDAAWKWIEFLDAPQNMALWNVGTKKEPSSLLPPRKSLIADQTTFSANPQLRIFSEMMANCGITNLSNNTNWGEVDGGPLSTALAKVIYGKADAATAMNDAESQANEILSKPTT